MKKTVLARALKVREEFQDIPVTIIQEYKEFFDAVWKLCETIINADGASSEIQK